MKKLILFFVLSGILFSCQDRDDVQEATNELNGEWHLVSVVCFCEPINLDFGEQIWEFDLSENKLEVVNNVTEQLHTILETGTYDISISEDKITILSIAYDFYFQDNKLYLTDQPESDGPIIEFNQL